MEFPTILPSTDFASDAFKDNIVRCDVLSLNCTVFTCVNSKKEVTAQSFHENGKVARA